MLYFVLVPIAFLTSIVTATVGIGGGMLLIAFMPGLLPTGAIVPVHGAVQLASNGSRFALALHAVRWDLAIPFALGGSLGAALGLVVPIEMDPATMRLLLGTVILLGTWLPPLPAAGRWRGRYAVLGAAQTFVSLFVGVAAPVNKPFLIRDRLTHDQRVVTHAVQVTALHLWKLAVFVALGFAFGDYALLIAAMAVAAVLGSWVGTHIRRYLPERPMRLFIKLLLTAVALRLLVLAGMAYLERSG